MRLPVALLLFSLLVGQGCSQTKTDSADASIPVQHTQSSPGSGTDSFLTPHEIALFLNVVRHLPDQQPPEFVESEVIPLKSTTNIEQAVQVTRASIRNAITAERQVTEWEQSLPLKRAFHELQVEPAEFARLMLKISCAWSAWQIRQERPLLEACEQLDARIAQLTLQAQHLPDFADPPEERELLGVLEDLVVLSEFLRLLEQVPAQSLQAVAQAQAELRRVLPESSLREEFARYLDAQSRILRAGFETR